MGSTATSISTASSGSFQRPGKGRKKERYDFYYYKGEPVAVKNHGPKLQFKHTADPSEYRDVSSFVSITAEHGAFHSDWSEWTTIRTTSPKHFATFKANICYNTIFDSCFYLQYSLIYVKLKRVIFSDRRLLYLAQVPTFQMRKMSDDNICEFRGLCLDGPFVLSVWTFCSRGSLHDIFEKDSLSLDWFFKYSLIRDCFDVRPCLH